MEQNRKLYQRLESRIAEKHPLIQVLVGPRQVGKTTAVKKLVAGGGAYEAADYPTPLPSTVIEGWWKKAVSSPRKLLAIDEVQKIQGWSEEVKRLWDRDPTAIKLILTGSSAILVEKALQETLVGRFELIRAEHWNYFEAKTVFELSLRQYIEFGCYPGANRFLNDLERWGAYVRDSIVEPVLGRDLLQLHPVEQPALLRQLFGVAVSLPAQVVSLQKIQGQLQGRGTLPTLQNYLRLFSESFIVSAVEKYSASAFRTKRSTPKLVVHDNGLVRAFERPIEQAISADRFGTYFENAVGSRLIESGCDVFYWKDRNFDVDWVVIDREGKRRAIEVKSSEIRRDELRGLFEFCKINPPFEPCLVSLVSQKIDGVTSIDAEEILSASRKY